MNNLNMLTAIDALREIDVAMNTTIVDPSVHDAFPEDAKFSEPHQTMTFGWRSAEPRMTYDVDATCSYDSAIELDEDWTCTFNATYLYREQTFKLAPRIFLRARVMAPMDHDAIVLLRLMEKLKTVTSSYEAAMC